LAIKIYFEDAKAAAFRGLALAARLAGRLNLWSHLAFAGLLYAHPARATIHAQISPALSHFSSSNGYIYFFHYLERSGLRLGIKKPLTNLLATSIAHYYVLTWYHEKSQIASH